MPVHFGELRCRSDWGGGIYPRTLTGNSNRVFAVNPDFGFHHVAGERRYMLKELWAAIQCGRNHGKANKYKERGNLEKAVKHFEQALPYAERTGNSGTVAFEMECIAITYQEMKKSSEAKKYAESSLKIYRALAEGSKDDFFAGAASRVEQLLGEIGA